MDLYLIIKTLHIISSTILFGTGMGIAFFMFRAYATNNLQERYYAVRATVMADYLFTAPAVVVQPLTSLWLMRQGGFHGNETWLIVTYALYVITGLCWLPVVWIQIRLKQILRLCLEKDAPLPDEYKRLFRWWFMLGWPAFLSLVAIFFLMVMKPT